MMELCSKQDEASIDMPPSQIGRMGCTTVAVYTVSIEAPTVQRRAVYDRQYFENDNPFFEF